MSDDGKAARELFSKVMEITKHTTHSDDVSAFDLPVSPDMVAQAHDQLSSVLPAQAHQVLNSQLPADYQMAAYSIDESSITPEMMA